MIQREVGSVMMGLLQDKVMGRNSELDRSGGGEGGGIWLIERAGREVGTHFPTHINGRLFIENP